MEKQMIPMAHENGVFLPYIRNKYVISESMHTGNHLRSYYDEVEERFIKLSKRIEKENFSHDNAVKEICSELEDIRNDLLNGDLKTNN